MATTKRIVCLANSRKLSGRCIAGKEVDDGAWVRPISAREHEEVSEEERNYENGRDPKVLDVIEIDFLEHRGTGYQQENWLLDPAVYWERVGQVTWPDLAALEDVLGVLWVNGFSTYHGLNDRIPLTTAASISTSLKLIHVPTVTLQVFSPGSDFGNSKRRVQGQFDYYGSHYRMWVTDPVITRRYLELSDGTYSLGESYITVSLGEPNNDGYCYKLIAAIINPVP